MKITTARDLMVMGNHHSPLVTKDAKIIGRFRLTDVFTYINDLVRLCKNPY